MADSTFITGTSPDRRRVPRRQEDGFLLARSRQLERELEAARSISEAITPPFKPVRLSQNIRVADLVEKAVKTALEVVEAESGSILLADFDTKQLIFHYSAGIRPVPEGTAIPFGKGIGGYVFSSGQPLIVPDVLQDARFLPDIDSLTGYRTHELIAVPLKPWKGEPIGVMEVINDQEHAGRLDTSDLSILVVISALLAAAIGQAWLFEEAKLAEIVHRLGDITHDVNNMLMPVIVGAKMMQDQIEVIEMIDSASRRIEDRMREISDCVKGATSPPTFRPCQIKAVVDSVIGTLRLVAEGKGVCLRTEGLDTLPSIMADERRLYSAFYNLINNAVPEVPSGGSVTVRGRKAPDTDAILLEIADTGRGMPPEIRESLFTARTISRKQGGTGLGTKIVKDVVDAHGGTITVESTEGVGTTFFIRLPMCPPMPC